MSHCLCDCSKCKFLQMPHVPQLLFQVVPEQVKCDSWGEWGKEWEEQASVDGRAASHFKIPPFPSLPHAMKFLGFTPAAVSLKRPIGSQATYGEIRKKNIFNCLSWAVWIPCHHYHRTHHALCWRTRLLVMDKIGLPTTGDLGITAFFRERTVYMTMTGIPRSWILCSL